MRAAVAFCAVLLAGCQTGLPADWEQSNPTAWQAVATLAQVRVYGPDAITTDPAPMLASCGRVGALEYAALARNGAPTQVCARGAVRAMAGYCSTLSPEVDYAGLTAAIRQVCEVTAGDTDCCLGLMVAAKRSK